MRSVVRATALVAAATVAQYFLRFVASVVLARVLSPEAFGSFALVSLVYGAFSLFSALQTEGIIIQSEEEVQRIFEVSFTLELLLALACCLLMIGTAPVSMAAVGDAGLAPYSRILALALLFNPFMLVRSFAVRRLDFKWVSLASLASIVLGAGTKIGLAASGFGVWSFVYGAIVTEGSHAVLLTCMMPQRPRLRLDRDVLRKVLGFTLPLTLGAILFYVWWHLDDLLVGRLLGSTQLGFYYLAFTIPEYVIRMGLNASQAVYPAFCRAEGRDHLRDRFTLVTKYSSLLFFLPCAVALAFGRDLIVFVYGEKWSPAVVPFQIFMILVALRLTMWHWVDLLKSQGRTKEPMYSHAFQVVLMATMGYYAVRRFGLSGMAFTILGGEIVFLPVVTRWVRSVVEVDYLRLLYRPLLMAALTTAVGVFLASHWSGSAIGALAGISIQVAVYGLLLCLLERPMLAKMREDLLKILKKG